MRLRQTRKPGLFPDAFMSAVKHGSPRSDETKVKISTIDISKDAKTIEVKLAELKAWHIHEVTVQNLTSSSGDKLTNNYIVYTLNRLLLNTPSDPLQIKSVNSTKKAELLFEDSKFLFILRIDSNITIGFTCKVS